MPGISLINPTSQLKAKVSGVSIVLNNPQGQSRKIQFFRDSVFSETGHRTASVERNTEYLSISIINHCQTTSMRVGGSLGANPLWTGMEHSWKEQFRHRHCPCVVLALSLYCPCVQSLSINF